jgi:hypothetical protein
LNDSTPSSDYPRDWAEDDLDRKIAQSITYCKLTVFFAMGRTIPTANMLIQVESDAFIRSYGKGHSGKREREALYDIL